MRRCTPTPFEMTVLDADGVRERVGDYWPTDQTNLLLAMFRKAGGNPD
jgi:hypothetical protein